FNFIYYIVLFLFFASCEKIDGTQLPYDYSQQDTIDLEEILEKADWKTKQVADGITWKHFQFSQIFESKQYINLFEIDLKKDFDIQIPSVKTGFLKTSAAATQSNALIAFNGSFFNTSVGGSTVFFKYDNVIQNQTANGFTPYRENGALVIDAAGKPNIILKPSAGWSSIADPVALAGGPLLIQNGDELSQLNVDFNTARHPRTAVGITEDQRMIVVVVDGRSSQSQGLSIPQLSSLMKALGCVSAINYDGGGSSTAWVTGEGVTNYPSDNGKFDHEGERAVATVFTIK
ncbi:MAG: phosphodiester glycosidase family protein, partial [Sphingobacterium sp.]